MNFSGFGFLKEPQKKQEEASQKGGIEGVHKGPFPFKDLWKKDVSCQRIDELEDESFFKTKGRKLGIGEIDAQYLPLEVLIPENISELGPKFESLLFRYKKYLVMGKFLHYSELSCSYIKAMVLRITSKYDYRVRASVPSLLPKVIDKPVKVLMVAPMWKGQFYDDLYFVEGDSESEHRYITKSDQLITMVMKAKNERLVEVPERQKFFFFSSMMREIEESSVLPKFSSTRLYEDRREEVSGYMWWKHSDILRRLEVELPICAPADGGGVVSAIFEGTVGGDLYPPSYVKAPPETIAQTMERGKSLCKTLILSHCFVFLTEEEWEMAIAQDWEIHVLDTAELFHKEFKKVAPGHYVRKRKSSKDTFIGLPLKVMTKIPYSSNILEKRDPIWLSAGQYMDYWQMMNPEDFPKVCTDADSILLAARGKMVISSSYGTLMSQTWDDFFRFPYSYFCPVGRVIGREDIITLVSQPRRLLCRTLYRFSLPLCGWKGAFESGFYSHVREGYYYFTFTGEYDRGIFTVEGSPDYGPPLVALVRQKMCIVRGPVVLEYNISTVTYGEISKDILRCWPSDHAFVISKLLVLHFFRGLFLKGLEYRHVNLGNVGKMIESSDSEEKDYDEDTSWLSSSSTG